MDQWAQIRFLRGQGLSIRNIAAEVGCAKKTVERALASDSPPEYSPREAKPTTFDAFEPAVRALLMESPRRNAKVIAQRVGWEGSESWFRKNVARIRPEYLPPDPVDTLEALAQAGVDPSVGTVGDCYDNALAKTVNGLYKTELVYSHRPWVSISAVHIATHQWVHWWNNKRLHESLGYITPQEIEDAYHQKSNA